jgi:hypothetical protein
MLYEHQDIDALEEHGVRVQEIRRDHSPGLRRRELPSARSTVNTLVNTCDDSRRMPSSSARRVIVAQQQTPPRVQDTQRAPHDSEQGDDASSCEAFDSLAPQQRCLSC